MVYCVWIDDVPDGFRMNPAQWRAALDKVFEPVLTPEEQVEKDAEDALANQERVERLRDSWGTSPEQQAEQDRMMSMGPGEST